jgi:O-acetyl-ADP-ribose deacetylase (regulator of RNase III)
MKLGEEFDKIFSKKKRNPFNKQETYEYESKLSIEERRKRYYKKNYVVLDEIKPWSIYLVDEKLDTSDIEEKFPPNELINSKISHWKGDIVTLEIDAIVNAANRSLLGGGGVDGVIHDAAGKSLYNECDTLGGCDTGKSKITLGYNLPARFVIHTVGPIGEHPEKLTSCYNTVLDLVKENGIKSVAFCGVSTGIYGYPVDKASNIACNCVRTWLENKENFDFIERIIFVSYNYREEDVYNLKLLQYFPPKIEKLIDNNNNDTTTNNIDISNETEPQELKVEMDINKTDDTNENNNISNPQINDNERINIQNDNNNDKEMKDLKENQTNDNIPKDDNEMKDSQDIFISSQPKSPESNITNENDKEMTDYQENTTSQSSPDNNK